MNLTKTYIDCPACGSHEMKETSTAFVAECATCGALFGDTDLLTAARLVKPFWSERKNPPVEETRYFDFTVEDQGGRTSRTHGWFDIKTRGIVQVG